MSCETFNGLYLTGGVLSPALLHISVLKGILPENMPRFLEMTSMMEFISVKFCVFVFQKVNSLGNVCGFFVELGRTVFLNVFTISCICVLFSLQRGAQTARNADGG